MIYFITIILSAGIGALAGRQGKDLPRAFLCFVALLPLCLLASVRSYTIGTDVMVYAYSVFASAPSLSMGGLVACYVNVEPGFTCLAWLVSILTSNNFQVMLFVLEFLIIAPVVYIVNRIIPHEIGTALLVYGFLLFGFGLCIIRQCVAASFLLLAGFFAWERKPFKFILAIIVAVSFHTIGLIGVLLWPLVSLFVPGVCSLNRSRIGHFVVIIICLSLCGVSILLALGDELISIAGQIKYTFAAQANYGVGTGLTISFIAYAAFAVLGYLFVARGNATADIAKANAVKMLLLVIVLAAAFAQFSLISTQLNRLGWLLMPAACLYWSLILSFVRERRLQAIFALTVLHAFFFVWIYAVGGVGNIYPYSSSIFPFLSF